MKPLTPKELFGTWATALLPLEEDGSIDWHLLEEEVDRLVESGVNGLYCNGTSGEYYNQSEEEFDRLAGLLAERCSASRMPFQIGVSHPSPLVSMERLRRTRSYLPSAFQLILPDSCGGSLEDGIRFLEKMAEAAEGIGLVLYNPRYADIRLSPEDIRRLAGRIPSLVGTKGVWSPETGTLCPGLSHFAPGHELASSFLEGASGSYSNVACLNPAAAQGWFETMLSDPKKALELEGRIQAFFARHITPYISQKGYSDQAVDKFLARLGGWTPIASRVRWPFKSIPESEARRLRPMAEALLPEFF